jgi:alpha-beta hydrolase superfamily lysophospholipase
MIETSLCFGAHGNLVGTICLPAGGSSHDGAPARAAIVLFNAGIVHRIGPHRINVTLARALAAIGIASIRFDLAGLGDSDNDASARSFEAQAVADIGAAMDALTAATGVRQFGLFGFCSGAFHSFNAAQADTRIIGIMMFEAYRYATLQSTCRRLWLRFQLHGVLPNLLRLAGKYTGQLRPGTDSAASNAAAVKASGAGFIGESQPRAAFAAAMRTLLARGVDVAMVFAGDGLETYNYAGQFAAAMRGRGIAARIPVTFLPAIDHVATGKPAQRQLIDSVLPWALRLARPQASLATPPVLQSAD